jgi:hypothetical protein
MHGGGATDIDAEPTATSSTGGADAIDVKVKAGVFAAGLAIPSDSASILTLDR